MPVPAADLKAPYATKEGEFTLAEPGAVWVLVHVPGAPAEDAAAAAKYLARGASLAGVRQVVLRAGSRDEVRSWAQSFAKPDAVLADAEGKLAAGLAKDGKAPVAVLFDAKGKELWRAAGPLPAFETFAAEVERLSVPPGLKDYNLPSEKTALKGFDPVGYFTENKALKGKESLRSSYKGVMYQFATAENREAFAQDPEKYLPTYGGWCATAMVDGEKVDIDPANFIVDHGRLFLFYKGLWGDARAKWMKDTAAKEKSADAAWKKLTGE